MVKSPCLIQFYTTAFQVGKKVLIKTKIQAESFKKMRKILPALKPIYSFNILRKGQKWVLQISIQMEFM